MSPRLLDGRRLAADLRGGLAARVARLAEQGVIPTLIIVIVGSEDPASLSYIETIARTAGRIGIIVRTAALPNEMLQTDVAAVLAKYGDDPAVHGIMLQQPLPAHLSSAELVESITPEKDVDGANPATQGHLALGSAALFTPATPLAVMELLRSSAAWPVVGKHAVVIGKSNVVGIPVALLLLHAGATVTVTHKDTVDLARHVRQADIVVSAAGVPHLVTADMLRPGVTVIDVGTTVVGDMLRGDVDESAAQAHAAEYTPVPGGVGPVTTAALLANVVTAAERRAL